MFCSFQAVFLISRIFFSTAECKSIMPDKNPGVLPCSVAPLSGQTMPSSIFAIESGRNPPSDFQIHQKNSSAKIILQLFPLNENTRLGLEKVLS